MSSANTQAQKVLRIGLFQNNRIIEERMLRQPGVVSVGQLLKGNLFVVPASDLPPSMVLFEPKGSGYLLRITPQMTGRVRIGDSIATLQDLIQSGRAKKVGADYAIELGQDSQGRVVVGEATFLFQFVTPPPVRPRPVLPASMKGGWMDNFGPMLLGALTFSAVVQIGFVVGLLMQDWPEPLDNMVTLPDRFVTVVVEEKPVEPELLPQEPVEGEGEGEEVVAEAPSAPAKKEEKPSEKPSAGSADEQAKADAERKKRLSESVQSKTILGQIGAVSADGGGGGLVDVLSEGAGKTSMDDAFANSKGVATNVAGAERSGLRSSGSSGADGAGKTVGIGDLQGTSGAKKAQDGVGTGNKTEVTVKAKIRFGDGSDKIIGASGKLDSKAISDNLKRKESAFQKCFERELKKNPKAGGKVVVQFEISPAGSRGRVTASKASVDSVGGGVGDCVADEISRIPFPPPEGGKAIASKTFVFEAGR